MRGSRPGGLERSVGSFFQHVKAHTNLLEQGHVIPLLLVILQQVGCRQPGQSCPDNGDVRLVRIASGALRLRVWRHHGGRPRGTLAPALARRRLFRMSATRLSLRKCPLDASVSQDVVAVGMKCTLKRSQWVCVDRWGLLQSLSRQ